MKVKALTLSVHESESTDTLSAWKWKHWHS